MATTARTEFSFDRPFIVSASELVFAGKRYRQGARFPWRDLGVARDALWDLWWTFKIDCTTATPPPAQKRK